MASINGIEVREIQQGEQEVFDITIDGKPLGLCRSEDGYSLQCAFDDTELINRSNACKSCNNDFILYSCWGNLDIWSPMVLLDSVVRLNGLEEKYKDMQRYGYKTLICFTKINPTTSSVNSFEAYFVTSKESFSNRQEVIAKKGDYLTKECSQRGQDINTVAIFCSEKDFKINVMVDEQEQFYKNMYQKGLPVLNTLTQQSTNTNNSIEEDSKKKYVLVDEQEQFYKNKYQKGLPTLNTNNSIEEDSKKKYVLELQLVGGKVKRYNCEDAGTVIKLVEEKYCSQDNNLRVYLKGSKIGTQCITPYYKVYCVKYYKDVDR